MRKVLWLDALFCSKCCVPYKASNSCSNDLCADPWSFGYALMRREMENITKSNQLINQSINKIVIKEHSKQHMLSCLFMQQTIGQHYQVGCLITLSSIPIPQWPQIKRFYSPSPKHQTIKITSRSINLCI